MGKYGNIKARDLERIALNHGFWFLKQPGTSHKYYTNGKIVVQIPVHKGTNIGKGLAAKIIKTIEKNSLRK